MTRMHCCPCQLTAAFSVGCALFCVSTMAQGGWPQAPSFSTGRASNNVQGFMRNPGGTAHNELRNAWNSGHNSGNRIQSAVGSTLGNSVPVKPSPPTFRPPTNWSGSQIHTNYKPTIMGTRQNVGMNAVRPNLQQVGPTFNQTIKAADRTLQGPMFQRTMANPMPAATGSRQIRDDLRNSRAAAGVGMSALHTNVFGGASAIGKLNRQTQGDVKKTLNQMRDTIRGHQSQIIDVPPGRKPQGKPQVQYDPGLGLPGGVQSTPAYPNVVANPGVSTYPPSNTTAETLNGVANLFDAIANAAQSSAMTNTDVNCPDCLPSQTSSESFIPDPVFTQSTTDQTSVTDDFDQASQPVSQSVLIYNAQDVEQSFQVENASIQGDRLTLQPSEAIEINASSLVLTFIAGQQQFRYTLSSGKAYKFSTGSDGQLNLFSFDPATLSAP